MKTMNRLGIKINETTKHYIGLFASYSLLLIVMFGSVYLAESTEWFAEIWSSKTNRILIICILPPILLYFCYQLHSYFWGKKKLIRSFKGIERFKLKNCKEGEKTRIQGKLRLIGKPRFAPLSQRKCAAYMLRASHEVEIASQSGNGIVSSETTWETFKFIQDAKDFLIECDDKYALIRTSNSKVIIQPDTVHDESDYDKDKGGFLTAKENEFREKILSSIGINSRRFTGVYAENIKFEEGVLEEDEQVAIVGLGQWQDTANIEDLSNLSKNGITTVFEVYSTDEIQVCISDSQELLD